MTVYSPEEDSFMLERLLTSLDLSGKVVCDVGCGSGILSVAAAKSGGEVIAVDVNEDAVQATNIRADKCGVSVKAVQSDLFSFVDDTFDVIVCNAPYLPEMQGEDDATSLQVSGGRHGMIWTWRFLQQAIHHLRAEGCIYLMTSSLARLDLFEESLMKYGLRFEIVIDKGVGLGERLFVYKLSFFDGLSQALHAGFIFSSYVSKGSRGVVYRGKYDGKDCACKLFSKTGIAAIEAENMQLVNTISVGPRYFFHDTLCLLMSFIDGLSLDKTWNEFSYSDKLLLARQLIDQCALLDGIGLNKMEMLRPYKNVLVGDDLSITLIDFERSRRSERPTNLTQLAQFMFRYADESVRLSARDTAKKYRLGALSIDAFSSFVFDTFKKSNAQ